MTEAEWLACDDPLTILHSSTVLNLESAGVLSRRVCDRKFRLYCCAVCRREWAVLTDELRSAVMIAESCADGLATTAQLQAVYQSIDAAQRSSTRSRSDIEALYLVRLTIGPLGNGDAYLVCRLFGREAGKRHQMALLRDLFGNPYRPVAFNPSWRTTDVLGLARSMYGSRNFSATSILADALEEAGCDNADILAHCRGDGPHVRGCWVVDSLLGKE